ncbi:hypothetical protein BH09PAT1_BH09PAT1_1600 [soil metagenome]
MLAVCLVAVEDFSIPKEIDMESTLYILQLNPDTQALLEVYCRGTNLTPQDLIKRLLLCAFDLKRDGDGSNYRQIDVLEIVTLSMGGLEFIPQSE